jgi:sulfatase modifying factor 1
VTFTDRSYPVTVSDFRLDAYEITVGRFRKFVAAYSQNMLPTGAGKNPNNASDPGWDLGRATTAVTEIKE